MECSLPDLLADVLALLGENAESPIAPLFPEASPHAAIGRKVAALLPGVGATLIADAPQEAIADSPTFLLPAQKTLMPSGGYAAGSLLPAGFLRLCSVRLECWQRDAGGVIFSDSPSIRRLWNPEPGIAGAQKFPMAYILPGTSGLQLFAMAAPDGREEKIIVKCWTIPAPDAEGIFRFPHALYNKLVVAIARQISA